MIALAFLPAPSLAHLRHTLPPPHQVWSAPTWTALLDQASAATADIVVVDPCFDLGRGVIGPQSGGASIRSNASSNAGAGSGARTGAEHALADRVRVLACVRRPMTPVVGYVSVSVGALRAVQLLVSSCEAEIVVRGVDDGATALREVLERSVARSHAAPLIEAIGAQLSPLPRDLRHGVELLFHRPEQIRTVAGLAAVGRTTRRSLDRWLARAGLAPARTLLACARVNAALHFLSTAAARPPRVAQMLGYSSARALSREVHWLTGVAPAGLVASAPGDVATALRRHLVRGGQPL